MRGRLILLRAVRKAFSDKVIFKQETWKKLKDLSQENIRLKSIPAWENNCKGPEVGKCLVCSKNSKKASSMARVEEEKERMLEMRPKK